MVRKMPYLLSGTEGIWTLRRIVETDAFDTPTWQGTMREVDLSEGFITKVFSLIDVADRPVKSHCRHGQWHGRPDNEVGLTAAYH